jgi:hypothetical protein
MVFTNINKIKITVWKSVPTLKSVKQYYGTLWRDAVYFGTEEPSFEVSCSLSF